MTEHQVAMVERHVLDRAHRALERVLVRVETTAEMAGTIGGPQLAALVGDLLDAVDATLLGHMEWEEQVCYPETDRIAATPAATLPLRVQHEQIRRCLATIRADGADLVDDPGHRAVAALRGDLYALHAILGSHLQQEEHALLTLLSTPPVAPRG